MGSAEPQPASQILDILPGDTSRPRAARPFPFERFRPQEVRIDVEPQSRDIAVYHVEIIILRAIVEADPQAEAVAERYLLLHRLAGIDRGRAFVLDHVARHQVAAV